MYNQIADIFSKYKYDEKIFLARSLSEGEAFINNLVENDFPCFNLKSKTLYQLCYEILELDILTDNLTVAGKNTFSHLILSILDKLKANNELVYLNHVTEYIGVSNLIYDAIIELKLGGVLPNEIKNDAFLAPNKRIDFVKVFEEYERNKKALKLIDEGDLFSRVLLKKEETILGKVHKTVIIIPNHIIMSKLQSDFIISLKSLNFERVELLIESVEKYFKWENLDSKMNRINERDYIKNRIFSVKPKFYTSYGEINEINKCICEIIHQKENLDETIIITTSIEPYTQICYDISKKSPINFTFGDGISIFNSKVYKLLSGILRWIDEDFNAGILLNLINNQYLSNEKFNDSNLVHILKLLTESEIFRGRERYAIKLSKLKNDIENKSQEFSENDLKVKLEAINACQILTEMLFENIPKVDENMQIDYNRLICGLIRILESNSTIECDNEFEANEKIISTLSELLKLPEIKINLHDAVSRIERITSNIRIKKENSRGKHLHITSFENALFETKKKVYVLGLDFEKFPKIKKQNPILLEDERSRIFTDLLKENSGANESIIELIRVLFYAGPDITLAYSYFNLTENRENFPSNFLLQMYRMINNNDELNYSDLSKKIPKNGFEGSENINLVNSNFEENKSGKYKTNACECIDNKYFINKYEYYINRYFSNGIKNSCQRHLIDLFFPHLKNGIIAEENRKTEVFGEYDGKVNVDINDIIKDNEFNLSSSQLELYGECGFKYFLKYILKIKKTKNLEDDPYRWLDSKDRGSLLHKVFERFYKRVSIEGKKISKESHITLIEELAIEEINKYKSINPPYMSDIFEAESIEILKSCRIFVNVEEGDTKETTPKYFELGIEVDIKDRLNIKNFSNERIKITGKIDRIDEVGKEEYIILDYKTGSLYNFSEEGFFENGKKLQHFIYSIALEKFLIDKGVAKNPKVIKAGFYFPTVKGEGKKILKNMDDDKRKIGYIIVQTFINLILNGIFYITDKETCKFCDYISSCRKDTIRGYLSIKQSDPALSELVEIRENVIYV